MTASATSGGVHRYNPFETPLVEAVLVRRYKRFLADLELADGTLITAHCANSGSMMGMKEPGMACMVRHVPDPKRALQWTWELVAPDGKTWVGCNTMRPNQVVEHAIHAGLVDGLDATNGLRREVKYGRNSRIDILLGTPETGLTYVEVKNTTLERGGRAEFPDAVTERGAKHMDELRAVVKAGHQAAVVFFVNRADCHSFSPACDIDPDYAKALERAQKAGVRVLALGMDVNAMGWTVRGPLPHAADPVRARPS